MKAIKNLHEIFYVFGHHVRNKIRGRQPLWPYVKQFPYVIYFNIYKKNPIDLELPWLTIEAILHLKRYLSKDMRVLEYGSGGSTLFFCQRVKELVSIEHDAKWFELVENRVRNKNSLNTKLFLVLPTKSKASHPVRYASVTRGRDKNLDYYDYVSTIDQFIDEYFDVIVIDGRARTYCLKHSVNKLRSGGLLVFDNADRVEYQEQIRNYLSGWETYSYTGHIVGGLAIATTNIYIKPF